jgi:SSS family solute:Na+ symporter
VYRRLRPEASERQLVWVGQISTVVLVGFGLAWIPMMELVSAQLYKYLQSVQAYISPPIAAVFLLGVFYRRVNATGAIASLLTGFVLGMGRLICELEKDSLEGWLFAYADMNFLHFAVLLFVVCTAVLVVVSFASPPPSPEKLAFLDANQSADGAPRSKWKTRDMALSLLLLAIVGALWIYFA